MAKEKTLSERVKEEINMVEFLFKLGYRGEKKGQNYFFNSPLRDEKTPSFSVHPVDNVWKDWGDGSSGNFIDFGERKYGSVSEFFKQLKRHYPSVFVNTSPTLIKEVKQNKGLKEEKEESEIKIIEVKSLYSYPLLRYLEERRIPRSIADEFCKEVSYVLKGKTYYAIGFKNNSGGFALRNRYIKQATTPNDVTLIANRDAKELAVFEGFFDFLSYKKMYYNQEEPKRSYLILNSTSFFEKQLTFMQEFKRVHLFLDNDKTGQKCTEKALELDKVKFIDQRGLYRNYNDLNDWLMNFGRTQKQGIRQSL